MEMQELEITIDREGRVHVAVRGGHGGECLGITKNIEQAVGSVEERIHTAEFYEQPVDVGDHQYLTR